MINKTLSNGQIVNFHRFQGTVSQSQENVVTTISQGREIRDGKLELGAISSSTENVHKIWLKSPTGQEEHFDLSQTGVELREGHEILVVSGGDVTGTKSSIMRVHNLTTNKMFWSDDGYATSISEWRSVWKPKVGYMHERLWVLGVGFLVGWWAARDITAGPFSAAAFWFLWEILRAIGLSPARSREKALRTEIAKLAENLATASA
jgi:hypothetical protein